MSHIKYIIITCSIILPLYMSDLMYQPYWEAGFYAAIPSVVIMGNLILETPLRRYAYVWISSKGFNVSSFFFYVTFPFLHCLILFMHVIPSSCVFMQLHFLYYSYFFIWLLASVSLCLYTTLFGCLKLPVYHSLTILQ